MLWDQLLHQKTLQNVVHSLLESFSSYLNQEHISSCGFAPISQAHNPEPKL